MSHIVKKLLKYSFFIIIPILSVLLSRIFMIAQGEKNEEIVIGLMIGIALDLLYSIYFFVRSKRTKNDKRKNKIITSVSFVSIVVISVFLFFTSYVNDRTNEYKAKYFLDKNDYIKISELIVQHYERNDLRGEMSIWCLRGESEVIYGDSKNQESSLDISVPFKQNEVDEIGSFIHNLGYEYVSINERFIEFGNSTGSRFMYLCLTDERPEPISKNHKIYNLGDGWYFSQLTAR